MNKDDQFKDTSNCSSVRMTRKRMRQVALEKEARFISCENDEGNSVERESTQNFHKETAPDMVSNQNPKDEIYSCMCLFSYMNMNIMQLEPKKMKYILFIYMYKLCMHIPFHSFGCKK